jgi:hypothetical protein
MPHLRWIALVLLVAIFATVNGAWAAKEKFVRSKPHVNASGPLRLAAETLRVKMGLLAPAAQAGGPAATCSCTLDLRVVPAADPDGTPLAESRDVPISTGGTAELTFNSAPTDASPPVDVYVVVVAREMDGVKAPGCVLRGQIETADNATGVTTRSLPVRVEDFVVLQ